MLLDFFVSFQCLRSTCRGLLELASDFGGVRCVKDELLPRTRVVLNSNRSFSLLEAHICLHLLQLLLHM